MQKPDFQALLRQAGLKTTPWRHALMEVLWSEQKPFSVNQLREKLKGKINEVTLYRGLEALATAGIVRRVDLGHGHAHYELEKKHHHHFVCTDCGMIEDIKICPLPLLGKRTIYSHNLEFFGSCRACAK